MAKYRAKTLGYLGRSGGLKYPGDVFEWDGEPGAWMELIEEEGKKPKAKTDKSSEVKPPADQDVI